MSECSQHTCNLKYDGYISPVVISHEIYSHFITPSINRINASKKIPRKINYLTHQS
ncbi:hypothetical protein DDI_2877 [Dickeya dianthicola RNS04.9]|nr:hypothetical protein DDI_2877 [Dickeya dianthicola RNS04.9]